MANITHVRKARADSIRPYINIAPRLSKNHDPNKTNERVWGRVPSGGLGAGPQRGVGQSPTVLRFEVMERKIGFVKSLVIVFLGVLMVYQTGVLWFGNIAGRNFLLDFFAAESAIEGIEGLVVPKRIVVDVGGAVFLVHYNGIFDENYYTEFVMEMFEQLENADFVERHENFYTLSEFLNRGIIFEYAIPMEIEWLAAAAGIEMLVQIDEPIDKIIVSADGMQVFLVTEEYNYEFSMDLDVAIFGENFGERYFLAEPTGDIRTDIIPWLGGVLQRERPFYGVTVTNPYATPQGWVSLNFVQQQIAKFFSNPIAIRARGGDEVWIYMDTNAVLRYYYTHIIDFINYRQVDGTPSSFLRDYAVAVQFLEQDHLLTNRLYLANFQENESERIFYFNFILDNTTLPIPQGWPTTEPLNYPITITTEHARIVRYRKIALNFHSNEQLTLNSHSDLQTFISNLLR